MQVIALIYLIVQYAVVAVIILIIALMLLRMLMSYADVNPFTRPAMTTQRWSDTLVNPMRRSLAGFGVDPKYAPLVIILLTILLGWFVMQLAGSTLGIAAGVILSVQTGRPISLIGYVLYGALGLYSLLIFLRIIFSWMMVSYANRLMRFLVRTTDPLLIPLRRVIPPLGMWDISAIVAFLLIWLFQAAIKGTLIGA